MMKIEIICGTYGYRPDGSKHPIPIDRGGICEVSEEEAQRLFALCVARPAEETPSPAVATPPTGEDGSGAGADPSNGDEGAEDAESAHLDPEQLKTLTNAKLAELGYTPEDIAKLRAPDFCGRIGYPAYALQNNNANIRRIRGRIAELKKRTENTPEGWEFDGGRVVVNTAENRLQIIFDGKPDADIRTELKGEGFRWAPSQGAWQRQLTDNAMRAARRLKCIAPQV